MSNFDFLKEFDSTLWKLGNRIEKQVTTSPSGVKADATTFLEHILKKLLSMAGLKYNSRKAFTEQVYEVYRSDVKMSNAYRERIINAYNYRNKIHDEFDDIEKHEYQDAVQLHKKLFYIARKFYRDYNPDYDEYKGLPDFKPLSFDLSEDEIENRDFSEIIDVKFDYCVVCGEPNHLNYSIYCHKCSRKLDNANNFISVRNAFGKNRKFTKEDLIEYGMPEGYVNRFINSMVRENRLKVAGRDITFNNIGLDEYLTQIDNYIAVGELITRFIEDEISPVEIIKSREYVLGSRKEEPFYQFFKITNREIIKKFEKDLLTTEDIWKSIRFTGITQNQLKRWYERQLGHYSRGNVNRSFKVFNDLLITEYLDMKRQGIDESQIRHDLNVSDTVFEFFCEYKNTFMRDLKNIKLDLLSQAIREGKTKSQIIEYAGVSLKEYEDLIKVSEFKKNEFSQLRNQELELRKKQFIKYLYNFDLKIACKKAKFSLDDFYEHYENANTDSEFFIKSTRYLMDKFLILRRRGKCRVEAMKTVGIKEKYMNRWLSRSTYARFKDEDLKVTVDLILKGFRQKKPLTEIAETVEVKVNAINNYIKLGERGSELYKPLYEYYEAEILPGKLSKFLKSNEHKSIRKAMEAADLSDIELDKYYQLGKDGDVRFTDFYKAFYSVKKGTYVYHIERGKTHKIAMRESRLSEEEYNESEAEIDKMLRLIKLTVVLESVKDNKTSNVAASRARCTVDEIYEWYFKGKEGDEDYKDFYEAFHHGYVRPSIKPIQDMLDSEKSSYESIIRSNKDKFTRRDVEIWIEHGLINQKVVHINSDKDDKEDEDDEDKDTVKEINIKTSDKAHRNRSSSTLLRDNDMDVEKLKKEILKKH